MLDNDARWQGRAFGLRVCSPFPLPGAPFCDDDHAEPSTLISLTSAQELDRLWRGGDHEVLVDRRHANGRLMLTVEHRSDLGFRIWMPYYGRYVISSDGSLLRCALPKVASRRWQRLLFAQPLPLAALLQGRTVLHASAVAVGDRTLMFIAPSGTGKTSLAGHLVSRGATLMADDALALECAGERVLAHAATGLINIDAKEFATVAPELRPRLGTNHGHVDKQIMCSSVPERGLPVSRVYFLERGPQVERFAVQRMLTPDFGPFLGARFFRYVRRPEVWTDYLEVCAGLAASAELYTVKVPPGFAASRVATEIEARFDEAA